MANSKTSLNGYEYGRNPKTTAPFWAGESGEGASIDDTGIYTDKTWSSNKISDELAEKANASDLANYAKVTSVYTKSESYSKAEVDALIDEIPAVDAYTKTQTDSLLAAKANSVDVYTKSQTDNLLANKANASSVYTKTQTNNLLANKANSSDVYSKTQTYNKTEVDNLISGGGGGLQEYAYTIDSPSSTTIANAIMAALAAAITNAGIDNLEKLHKIVARTQWTYNRTPKVIEHIYDVNYMKIYEGTFENITLVAIGGDDYTSTGDTIKFTKFIASTDDAHLIIVEQSGTNPVVTFTDRSTTTVDANSSPWYHKELMPGLVSNLTYKLVFIYG